MSEGSKMGSFGSKDSQSEENKEAKAKRDSPERFATPYGVDSDSETYDTEALSIMDINDIIGVQAGPPSTFESEIAALSEVITDTKTETPEKDKPATLSDPVPDGGANASLSKSLALIGEYGLSDDDSMDSEEDTSDSNKKEKAPEESASKQEQVATSSSPKVIEEETKSIEEATTEATTSVPSVDPPNVESTKEETVTEESQQSLGEKIEEESLDSQTGDSEQGESREEATPMEVDGANEALEIIRESEGGAESAMEIDQVASSVDNVDCIAVPKEQLLGISIVGKSDVVEPGEESQISSEEQIENLESTEEKSPEPSALVLQESSDEDSQQSQEVTTGKESENSESTLVQCEENVQKLDLIDSDEVQADVASDCKEVPAAETSQDPSTSDSEVLETLETPEPVKEMPEESVPLTESTSTDETTLETEREIIEEEELTEEQSTPVDNSPLRSDDLPALELGEGSSSIEDTTGPPVVASLEQATEKIEITTPQTLEEDVEESAAESEEMEMKLVLEPEENIQELTRETSSAVSNVDTLTKDSPTEEETREILPPQSEEPVPIESIEVEKPESQHHSSDESFKSAEDDDYDDKLLEEDFKDEPSSDQKSSEEARIDDGPEKQAETEQPSVGAKSEEDRAIEAISSEPQESITTAQPDSELECAVKFLQESSSFEEQEEILESPAELSPKPTEQESEEEQEEPAQIIPEVNIVDELAEDLPDPIAISEAEIISEAAKLENEKKLTTQLFVATPTENTAEKAVEPLQTSATDVPVPSASEKSALLKIVDPGTLSKTQKEYNLEKKLPEVKKPAVAESVPSKPDSMPKMSVLEERLRVPPKIEIPVHDVGKACISPRTDLLIPKDAKYINQRTLDSPKERSGEVRTCETPTRKDSERHEMESVGSPRIILKIAKSAITDCGEPRSPKSPKVHSATNSPNPEDSPGQKLGKIKLKLSKGGHPSIISNENVEESGQWHTEGALSPIGVKIKLSKSGDASIVHEKQDDEAKDFKKGLEDVKRVDSPIGMKIKFTKSGDASIVQQDTKETSQEIPRRTESPIGVKIKLSKSGDASIIQPERQDVHEEPKDTARSKEETSRRNETPIGMKIKLTKGGDATIVSDSQEVEHLKIKLQKTKGGASIVPAESYEESIERIEMPEVPKRTESPIGMKFKLSKSGDASIIHSEIISDEPLKESSKQKESAEPIKIKLSKTGDAAIIHPEQRDDIYEGTRRIESPLGMKIKLSKTGDATIVQSEVSDEVRRKDESLEMKIKLSRDGHPKIITDKKDRDAWKVADEETPYGLSLYDQQSKAAARSNQGLLQTSRSEISIEPIAREGTSQLEKRKDVTVSPVEAKKSRIDAKMLSLFPDITLEPVSKEPKKSPLESHSGQISRQQMSVLNQEISITQIMHQKSPEVSVQEKLKDMIHKKTTFSPSSSDDCQIIEQHRPELVLVSEPDDIMIIDEVMPVVKVPKKRGRPRRIHPMNLAGEMHDPQRDPLMLPSEMSSHQPGGHGADSKDRPRRTCRSQKSYAPPKRGRGGRGRGKRKLMEAMDYSSAKQSRMIEQDLTAIEMSTTSRITFDEDGNEIPMERFKPMKQPRKIKIKGHKHFPKSPKNMESVLLPQVMPEVMPEVMPQVLPQMLSMETEEEMKDDANEPTEKLDSEVAAVTQEQNWLTPISKKTDVTKQNESSMSSVQVIDEETRMSSESGSRSQTPARNIIAPASEAGPNEESQGSVLSTATTESEKVKVKNRRMEINFDPDEGPFTVDKIAEYDWPLDRKGDTSMVQEQISQYLGVKSFKRKYPDLKRRMVDMEERNFLRENGLVSESLCDMGLTAVYSSEVLDIMCSDFPEHYEEYRKHMREKQIKEHAKKQKELSAAANAERNRLDLAEMAVQSALSWNLNLNKTRSESRKCSLDLQTYTIHVPKKQQKVADNKKNNNYPVALIPGQYTDYYREYTSAELRYYPLNTVMYGPTKPNERKFIDSQSEGSQSDSDSDSSSDDSSSSSSEDTQNTEGSQSTMDDVDAELAHKENNKQNSSCKMCFKSLNKQSKVEVLIQCGTCSGHVHPSCIDLTLDMVPHIQRYAWQCTDCKTCAQCHDPADEDKMLFCDMCDRGYHIYCVGLRKVPQGRWHCQECAICANCGTRDPGGPNADKNNTAQWQHEYKKGDRNTRHYVSTFCLPCSKLWRKGRYCPICSHCHTAQRLEQDASLVHCCACDKYLHLDCVEIKAPVISRKNYLCEFCSPTRQRLAKTFRTFRT